MNKPSEFGYEKEKNLNCNCPNNGELTESLNIKIKALELGVAVMLMVIAFCIMAYGMVNDYYNKLRSKNQFLARVFSDLVGDLD